MFDLALSEMAVIALLVLVFFDADQLPGLMRQAGKLYAKVRGASDDLRRAFNAEVARAESDQRRVALDKRRDEVNALVEARRKPNPAAAPDGPVMRPRGPVAAVGPSARPTPPPDPPPTSGDDSGGEA